METLNTIYYISAGDRQLTITKSKDSVDIRITKFAPIKYIDKMAEKVAEEELNIPITMDTYYRLVNEMSKGCLMK